MFACDFSPRHIAPKTTYRVACQLLRPTESIGRHHSVYHIWSYKASEQSSQLRHRVCTDQVCGEKKRATQSNAPNARTIDEVPALSLRITQEDDHENGQTMLRVEGSLRLTEAVMLEKLCHDLRQEQQRGLVIDLAGVTFLNDESARVLRRLKSQPGITFAGLQLFTRLMLEQHDD